MWVKEGCGLRQCQQNMGFEGGQVRKGGRKSYVGSEELVMGEYIFLE